VKIGSTAAENAGESDTTRVIVRDFEFDSV
jgi:hypothetical protein